MKKLDCFIEAQKKSWPAIIYEMRRGYKRTPWMSYVFPVLESVSYNSNGSFSLESAEEAREYIQDEYLKGHMEEIINILLNSENNDPYGMFGFVDAEKLQASMTLFYIACDEKEMFQNIINKFFNGEFHKETEKALN